MGLGIRAMIFHQKIYLSCVIFLHSMVVISRTNIPTIFTPINGSFASNFLSFVQNAANQKIKYVAVAPGKYVVHPTKTSSAHIYLQNINDIEINMCGVIIICTVARMNGFFITASRNVTVRGLTIQYQPQSTIQGRIEYLLTTPNQNIFGLKFNGTGGFLRNNASIVCYLFDSVSKRWKPHSGDMIATGFIKNISQWTGEIYFPKTALVNNGAVVGDLVACRGYETAYTVANVGCSHTSFVDVHIVGGSGFGFFEGGSGSYGNHSYIRCSVRAAPGILMALSADGFHSSGLMHGPRVEQCYFERMPDDGIAIHGTFSLIGNGKGVHLIVSNDAGFAAGEVIRIYNNSLNFVSAHKIANVLSVTNYTPLKATSQTLPRVVGTHIQWLNITVFPALPYNIPFDFVLSNENRVGSGFLIVNNTLAHHRARGLLIKASRGTIVGNTLNYAGSMYGMEIAPEVYWAEAEYSHNIQICGNTIRSTAYHLQQGGGICVISTNADWKITNAGNFFNFDISHNVIIGVNFTNLIITSASNVMVRGNRFLSPLHQGPWYAAVTGLKSSAVVSVASVENVSFQNNCIVNKGLFATTALSVLSGKDISGTVQECSVQNISWPLWTESCAFMSSFHENYCNSYGESVATSTNPATVPIQISSVSLVKGQSLLILLLLCYISICLNSFL